VDERIREHAHCFEALEHGVSLPLYETNFDFNYVNREDQGAMKEERHEFSTKWIFTPLAFDHVRCWRS
jgi:hypothetical protein